MNVAASIVSSGIGLQEHHNKSYHIYMRDLQKASTLFILQLCFVDYKNKTHHFST
jgi:hypothetical protein